MKVVQRQGQQAPGRAAVPMSALRRATAAYIVFIAAKLLPTAMMVHTSRLMNLAGVAETI
jgi:hypothetical protein